MPRGLTLPVAAEERYTELEVRALTGAGAEQAVRH